MGCVVNGPGEARDADLGIAAGRKRGHLFVKGKVVEVVPEDEMVDALVEWADIIAEEGVEGALTHADAGAAAEAEADRAALLDEQGADANASEQTRRPHPQAPRRADSTRALGPPARGHPRSIVRRGPFGL